MTVIGGKYISTKISTKHNTFFIVSESALLTIGLSVTLGGAVLFLLFGMLYLYEVFMDRTAQDVSMPIINHPEDT
jgi:Ca2+/H+ antiporter, TMEM165/GDT1 family